MSTFINDNDEYNLNIAERDLKLLELEDLINAKTAMLLKKKGEIEKKEKVNKFLGKIKNDYSKYHNYIMKEKEEQYKAMDILNQYISYLSADEEITGKYLNNVKRDQQEILDEMNKLKHELDKIVKQ
jgi:biotin-(acetyl-CoA carboxylase) ligase